MATNPGGRPRTIDPVAIIHTATRLMYRQGYANTTMQQVAEACGISRKSLFVYFPTKSDLIWASFAEYAEGMRTDLEDTAPATDHPLHAISEAIIAGVSRAPSSAETQKLKIEMIETDQELSAYGEVHSRIWRAAISDFLYPRFTDNSALARALAYGFWDAQWHALHRWRASDAPSPESFQREELDRYTGDLRTLHLTGR